MSEIDSETKPVHCERRWLIAAMLFALLYAGLALRLAFRHPLLVQDDARQHVFWMARFIDPSLFPHDLIADYFQSVAPGGYKAVYWSLAKIGIAPLIASKILPACIALLSAWLAFRVFMELMADPRGAFIASVLLSQMLWMTDDVMSGTPRAFVYPLFLLFLLFLLRRQLIPCAIAVVLQGLFYPQSVFVSCGVLVLRLIRRENGRLRFTSERSDWIFSVIGLAAAGAVMIPFALASSPYGPVITKKAAKHLPEFGEGGRSEFFIHSPLFWVNQPRSGLFPRALYSWFMWTGLALPWLYFRGRLNEQARRGVGLLWRIVLTAVAMWAAAHLLLFKLHLPSRYTHWSLRIVLAMGAGIVLATTWEALRRRRQTLAEQGNSRRSAIFRCACVAAGAALILWPHFMQFPDDTYFEGRDGGLYGFLRKQPADAVIASTKTNADMIPTFAHRSIYVGREFAIPYHMGYYNQVKQRGIDLMGAQYSADPAAVADFVQRTGVDYWVLDPKWLEPETLKKTGWFREVYPVRSIRESLEAGQQPALAAVQDRCTVYEDKKAIVLDANRVAEELRKQPTLKQSQE
jgi:hypothetical protein